MLTIYEVSIAIYFIGFSLCYARSKANRIKFKKSEEGKLYSLVRIIGISVLPIMNLYCGVIWIWMSLLQNRKKFIDAIEYKE